MFKHILVPIDFSQHAMNAVEAATDLARRMDAKVELLNIITIGIAVRKNQQGKYESMRDTAKGFIDQVILNAEKQLERFKEEVAYKHVEIITKVLVADESKSLATTILENKHDLLVVSGRRKHHVMEVFDVPIREKVIHLAQCPVLIVNEHLNEFRISKMVFATHFRQNISPVAESILEFKRLFMADADLLFVNTPNNFYTTDEIEQQAATFKENHQLDGFELAIYNDRKAEQGIMHYTEKVDADLTVVCTNGNNWMKHLFQGYVADGLVMGSPKPVLIFNLAKIRQHGNGQLHDSINNSV